ncbi:hypothetical protein AGRO_2155 [Agrobacterium sp. ATCC 31749]|nr:hypothetical protein AGRO_2155 [Agrobacterium sp. ATCC 31749]
MKFNNFGWLSIFLWSTPFHVLGRINNACYRYHCKSDLQNRCIGIHSGGNHVYTLGNF